ncbi:MAG TPA: DoxX family protein [Caulobacteraceae bacterium]
MTPSKAQTWGGWALTGLVVLFLVTDGAMKFMNLQQVRDATGQLGWPQSLDHTVGAIELGCLVLYAIPRTAALGAVLLTGLLGGAIASHLRVPDPLFSHTLFGVYVGLMAWGGLWLRDAKLRALMPLRR